MPEMPEMQALAERLTEFVGGHELAAAHALQFSALKTAVPPPESLHGRAVSAVGRRGKFLVFGFGGPRLLVHLSQGGRIDVEDPPKTTRPKGALVRFRFDAAPSLLLKEFGTQRKAGWWVLAEEDDGPLARLGPEPGSDDFVRLIRESRDGRRVHGFLRDQRTVAGIGRGYSDEILHRARISPFSSIKTMDDGARERLLAATDEVLAEGLAAERKRRGGLPAKLSDRWSIHGRAGSPCPRCDEPLRRVSYEDYEIAYCASCQTGGKVLADRRLSKLLK